RHCLPRRLHRPPGIPEHVESWNGRCDFVDAIDPAIGWSFHVVVNKASFVVESIQKAVPQELIHAEPLLHRQHLLQDVALTKPIVKISIAPPAPAVSLKRDVPMH